MLAAPLDAPGLSDDHTVSAIRSDNVKTFLGWKQCAADGAATSRRASDHRPSSTVRRTATNASRPSPLPPHPSPLTPRTIALSIEEGARLMDAQRVPAAVRVLRGALLRFHGAAAAPRRHAYLAHEALRAALATAGNTHFVSAAADQHEDDAPTPDQTI
ncbi:hypothetical protein MSG28_001304 [Choristoneura fumiferana]|uniref:Uncharacterized protein n=1 Tax=Choristoneura fumiferana TaxID=7141 RepID=A0ACC0K4H6_CHOFU|nr:hypothetical protein MSG28_001304 [Choristoneura fumiferana]